MKAIPIRPAVYSSVLEILRDLTVLAESGEIVEISFIAKQRNGDWRHSSSASENGIETAAVLLRECLARLGI